MALKMVDGCMFKGVKDHENGLFSLNEVSDSESGKKRLLEFFNTAILGTGSIFCECERPLLNLSFRSIVNSSPFSLSDCSNVVFNDFELSFSYVGADLEPITKLLLECFYFYQHVTFVFLPEGAEQGIGSYKRMYGNLDSWQLTCSLKGLKSRFVFKSAEDDVVWYREIIMDTHQ